MRTLGTLELSPAVDRLDLLAPPVREALVGWAHADEVLVAPIDPALADTATMSEAYQVPMRDCANCVVVAGRRGGEERVAACLVRADTRAQVNTVVRGALDVRKCSFFDHDRAVSETRMEHGGITPMGLPPGWRLLLDARVLDIELAVVGSGVRGSKLFVPGPRLADLPGAEVVPDLAV